MVPDPTTIAPTLSIAPSPGPNAYTPPQVIDAPSSPAPANPPKPFTGPAIKTSNDPPKETGAAVDPNLKNPVSGNDMQPSKMVSDSLPQVSLQGAAQDPPGVDPNKDEPVTINNPTPTPFITTLPSANQNPPDFNDESGAQMSALYQALGQAPPAGSEAQPARTQKVPNPPVAIQTIAAQGPSDPNDEPGSQMSAIYQALEPTPIVGPRPQSTLDRPAANAFVETTSPPTAVSGSKSLISALNGPIPPKGDVPFTTIQLGPQFSSKPTTLYVGSGRNENPHISNPGVSINDALSTPASAKHAPVSFPVVTAAGNIITVSDPSKVSLAGGILTPGGSAITLSGTPITLATGGNLILGSDYSDSSSTVMTVAGHVFTARPRSFDIAGTPVKAGEAGVMISGTIVSLGSSGDLVIDPTANAGAVPPVLFSAAGRVFTVNPSGVAVAGSSLSIGGPRITVGGTPISLDPSGSLIIGTSTIPLEASMQSTLPETGYSPSKQNLPVDDITTATSDGIRANGSLFGTSAVSSLAANGPFSMTSDLASLDLPSVPPSSIFSSIGSHRTKNGADYHKAKMTMTSLWGLFIGVFTHYIY